MGQKVGFSASRLLLNTASCGVEMWVRQRNYEKTV